LDYAIPNKTRLKIIAPQTRGLDLIIKMPSQGIKMSLGVTTTRNSGGEVRLDFVSFALLVLMNGVATWQAWHR